MWLLWESLSRTLSKFLKLIFNTLILCKFIRVSLFFISLHVFVLKFPLLFSVCVFFRNVRFLLLFFHFCCRLCFFLLSVFDFVSSFGILLTSTTSHNTAYIIYILKRKTLGFIFWVDLVLTILTLSLSPRHTRTELLGHPWFSSLQLCLFVLFLTSLKWVFHFLLFYPLSYRSILLKFSSLLMGFVLIILCWSLNWDSISIFWVGKIIPR